MRDEERDDEALGVGGGSYVPHMPEKEEARIDPTPVLTVGSTMTFLAMVYASYLLVAGAGEIHGGAGKIALGFVVMAWTVVCHNGSEKGSI